MGNHWKTIGVSLLAGGGLVVSSLHEGYRMLGNNYWWVGGTALAISVVGGVIVAWAERRWPSPRPGSEQA